MKTSKPIIGFVGQGWIGGNYADDFESRGYKVIRYDLSPKYKKNKNKIKDCQVVFVAVPTPTTPDGFDDSILIDAIKSATVKGQIIVIKSTVKIGTTDKIQAMFKDRYILHSPEFLTEKTAAHDAANPARNIVGYTSKSFKVAQRVMEVLPCAPFEILISCREAEFVKYMGNCWFYSKVMMMNIFYEIAIEYGLDFELLKQTLSADKRVGRTHLDVVHQGGRGAGGHCFIKDFETLREMYSSLSRNHSPRGDAMLKTMSDYNFELLEKSNKDLDLLKGVFGYK